STCMANITSMSKRRTPARTYARSDRQDGRASVQNFSDAPGKPITKEPQAGASGEGFRPFWYEILLRRTGHKLRGCGLRQGRRSCCAYGGAIPGRSGLHTIAPLSRLPARLLG